MTKFKKGDYVTIRKPDNIFEGPSWNVDDDYNMDYLAEGVHEITGEGGYYLHIYDERIKTYWSIDPAWCTLAYQEDYGQYTPVIRKIKRMERVRKEAGYAF